MILLCDRMLPFGCVFFNPFKNKIEFSPNVFYLKTLFLRRSHGQHFSLFYSGFHRFLYKFKNPNKYRWLCVLSIPLERGIKRQDRLTVHFSPIVNVIFTIISKTFIASPTTLFSVFIIWVYLSNAPTTLKTGQL